MSQVHDNRKEIGTEECECGEEVTLVEMVQLLGPNKGETIVHREGCKCEEIALAQQALKAREELKKKRMVEEFDNLSLANAETFQASFRNFIPTSEEQSQIKEYFKDIARHLDKIPPITVILTSSPGRGKSHLAYATARNLTALGSTALFVDVNNFLRTIKGSWSKKSDVTELDLMEYIGSVELFVLDDLGAEYERSGLDGGGDWSKQKIFELLELRTGKHNIITTNLSKEDLIHRYGGNYGRNISRLFNNVHFIEMPGEDYRLLKSQQNKENMPPIGDMGADYQEDN